MPLLPFYEIQVMVYLDKVFMFIGLLLRTRMLLTVRLGDTPMLSLTEPYMPER